MIQTKAEVTKDAALRQAKLNYLASQDNRGAHPFSWAGFVVIGDTDAIQFREARQYWRWIFLGVFLFLLIAIIFKRNHSALKTITIYL